MAAKIVDEKIGNMLNEWYKSLKENKLTKASEWQKVIEMLLPQIKENRHLSHYFELLDSRFTQLTEHFNRSGHVLQEGVHTKTDHMLQYYFYFFSGMYQFDQKNFLKAIDFFRITEQKLANIDDEIEKAEFHYHLSIVYYKIRQNYFSLSHAEKAFDSFKAQGSYLAKTLKCEMVIAANEADLEHDEKAEQLYKHALKEAASLDPLTESNACFHLGICYERRNLLSGAKRYIERAAVIHEQQHSMFAVRSTYMLSRINYKLNLHHEARKWYWKSLEWADKENEPIYKVKLGIICSLYERHDLLAVETALQQLKDQKLWSDVADLTLQAAFYHKTRGDSDIAVKYFEEACKAKDQMLALIEESSSPASTRGSTIA